MLISWRKGKFYCIGRNTQKVIGILPQEKFDATAQTKTFSNVLRKLPSLASGDNPAKSYFIQRVSAQHIYPNFGFQRGNSAQHPRNFTIKTYIHT